MPLEADVPPAVTEAIMASLAFDPADGPTPSELSEQIEPVLGAMPNPRPSELKPRLGR